MRRFLSCCLILGVGAAAGLCAERHGGKARGHSDRHTPATASGPAKGEAAGLDRRIELAVKGLERIAVRFPDGKGGEFLGWPNGRTVDEGPQWYTNEAGAAAKDGPMIDLQPGGTPTVGYALIKAYQASRDARYLDLARRVGDTLLSIQGACNGGWHYDVIYTGGRWRSVMVWGSKRRDDVGMIQGAATLDDGVSQSCALFLLRLYQAGGGGKYLAGARRFGDVLVGLKDVRDPASGEYPYRKGGIPQVVPLDVAMRIVFKSERGSPGEHYYVHKTLNDYTTREAVLLLIELWKQTKDPAYLAAIRLNIDYVMARHAALGNRGWCQQYHYLTDAPAWARGKEPPAMISGEHGIEGLLLAWHGLETDAERRGRMEEAIRTSLVYWKRTAPRANPDEPEMRRWRWWRYYDATDGVTPIFAKDYHVWRGAENADKGAAGQPWKLSGPCRWLTRILTGDDRLDLSRLGRWRQYFAADNMLQLRGAKLERVLETQDLSTGLWIKSVRREGASRRWADSETNAGHLGTLAGALGGR
jgi:hypothetical protein